MNLPAKVKKYLEKYSLNNWNFYLENYKNYETVIVIPVLEEFENVQKLFESLNKNNQNYFEKVLILLVINNIKSTPHEIKKDNERTINWLKKNHKENSYKFPFNFIDASSAELELPDKDGGVGLARKIGMDLALKIFDYESDRKKIIACLDADCIVSENYIEEIVANFNDKNLSAAFVNYYHPLSENHEKNLAIICYEIFLRYYVLGLRYAASPYAIHTIGSTMLCDYESYIKVEGMNKRIAAEDFYFMEKLAKNVEIFEIKTTAVYPSGRPSWRVPFGTGQRVSRYLNHVQDEYQLYNPYSFEVLKKWLRLFNDNYDSSNEYLSRAKDIDINLYLFLIEQKFEKDFERILANSKDIKQLSKQKKNWFDGFKTLKLIHYLRDKAYANKNMFDALDAMFANFNLSVERNSKTKIPELEIQKNYLELLRKIA